MEDTLEKEKPSFKEALSPSVLSKAASDVVNGNAVLANTNEQWNNPSKLYSLCTEAVPQVKGLAHIINMVGL